MQRPILTKVLYNTRPLPIERLFTSEDTIVVRAYNALYRNGIETIGDLMKRRAEVPTMRGIGFATWNAIIGCMMDFDRKNGTNLEHQFTSAS
jgi:DNA-directed RNA polymerase alpha subunit